MTREIINVNFADWVRKKRKERNLKQRDIAYWANCHENSIGRWEREEAYPTWDKAEAIIKKLGGEIVIREYVNERE